MRAEIIKINSKKLDKNKLFLVAKLVRQGGVVIFPTDTVYIPIADATNKNAVGKVFLLKKRKRGHPIPVFVKDIKMARRLAEINKAQVEFLKTVWPGRTTVVLKRKFGKTTVYGVDKRTTALRIPDYKPVRFLLGVLKRPLVATSANLSGRPASGKLKDVMGQFSDRGLIDLIVDGGVLPGKPSMVIDLTGNTPKIIRY